ncbi:TetR/AcrR family transcriptional regulator [Maribacter sp. 2307UL18-2]|uniref:TetR/AcrR family transcriptional regulator n=1 Tax=Maribacter sp. 2307UL18-2 TaxID=3386274 RepID=UPI0039BD6C59
MKVQERIITTATDLFHRQGYNATGINQIIEEAKVAKGSFYYNFKSKEDVCIAYLKARHAYWSEQLKTHIASSDSDEVLTAFDFLMLMNEKEDFRGCSFLNILSEIPSDNTKILSVIQRHKAELRTHFSVLLKGSALSDHVYLLFESAIIESQLYRKQWPVEKAKEIVEALLK